MYEFKFTLTKPTVVWIKKATRIIHFLWRLHIPSLFKEDDGHYPVGRQRGLLATELRDEKFFHRILLIGCTTDDLQQRLNDSPQHVWHTDAYGRLTAILTFIQWTDSDALSAWMSAVASSNADDVTAPQWQQNPLNIPSRLPPTTPMN
jgi:hypothetical protein